MTTANLTVANGEIQLLKPSEEILLVTPEGEFKWHEDADALIPLMGHVGTRAVLERLRAYEKLIAKDHP